MSRQFGLLSRIRSAIRPAPRTPPIDPPPPLARRAPPYEEDRAAAPILRASTLQLLQGALRVKAGLAADPSAASTNLQVLEDLALHELGFALTVRDSCIPNAGYGVFLKGRIPKGGVITMYPGTMHPGAAVESNAYDNAYLLCGGEGPETFTLDGCYYGGSADAFLETSRRMRAAGKGVNSSWLHVEPEPSDEAPAIDEVPGPREGGEGGGARDIGEIEVERMLALGHLINHNADNPTVEFKFARLPDSTLPLELQRLLPHAYAPGALRGRLAAVAVARHDLEVPAGRGAPGRELFADYGSCATKEGYRPWPRRGEGWKNINPMI